MPETTITIYRDQRDGLYELVRDHLGSIEDFLDRAGALDSAPVSICTEPFQTTRSGYSG